MTVKDSMGRKVFTVFNYFILIALSLICLLPMINVLALSFSSSSQAAAGAVKLWPMGFTLASYKYVLGRPEFFQSLLISIERVVLGLPINMLLTVLAAYPLSKDNSRFHFRQVYVWIFVITMYFSGGLIPWYMTIKSYHLLDTIWALVLPGALPIFNAVLLLNFFRGLPSEIEDAALVDGAGHFIALFKIYIPTSAPALATIALFSLVGHWNSWFDGLILMNQSSNYPLQTYLQTLIVSHDLKMLNTNELQQLSLINDRTFKAAQIFIAAIPIMIIYPFLQKYFTTGIVLGSVKG